MLKNLHSRQNAEECEAKRQVANRFFMSLQAEPSGKLFSNGAGVSMAGFGARIPHLLSPHQPSLQSANGVCSLPGLAQTSVSLTAGNASSAVSCEPSSALSSTPPIYILPPDSLPDSVSPAMQNLHQPIAQHSMPTAAHPLLQLSQFSSMHRLAMASNNPLANSPAEAISSSTTSNSSPSSSSTTSTVGHPSFYLSSTNASAAALAAAAAATTGNGQSSHPFNSFGHPLSLNPFSLHQTDVIGHYLNHFMQLQPGQTLPYAAHALFASANPFSDSARHALIKGFESNFEPTEKMDLSIKSEIDEEKMLSDDEDEIRNDSEGEDNKMAVKKNFRDQMKEKGKSNQETMDNVENKTGDVEKEEDDEIDVGQDDNNNSTCAKKMLLDRRVAPSLTV